MDRGPCGLEGGERLLDTVRHLRVEAWPKVLRDAADPETGERLLEHRRVLRHLIGERCGVARVVARDRLHDQRRIGRGSGHRADLIEARCEGHEATSADPAVGGLQAGDPAESGRLSDRATGIRADRDGGHVGCHAGRRAAARAARRPREVPRIVDGTERRVFVRAPHRELVHVGLADEHGVGLSQSSHHVGVVGRPIAREHLRGTGRRLVGGAEGVFHGHGEAGQWTERLAGFAAGVDIGGLGQRSIAIDMQEGIDRAVRPGDSIQKGLGDLHGGDVTLPDRGDEVDGGEFERLHEESIRDGRAGQKGKGEEKVSGSSRLAEDCRHEKARAVVPGR